MRLINFHSYFRLINAHSACPSFVHAQEMNVEGLTRENVASHLQKWRLQKNSGRAAGSGDFSAS